MSTAILIIWAITATAIAGVFHITLKIQQAHIELLESELRFAENEIETLAKKQKFQPVNRIARMKPR